MTNRPVRQAYFANLGNKLTVLVFATVLGTLILMGGAFWWIMGSFQEDQTRSKIADASRSLQFELRLTNTALHETARRLSHEADVISSVNLIHSYEDPAHYQPLVFDAEKRKLAQRLNQVAVNGHFDLIATYTPGGRISAFAIRHGNQMTPGFQTYMPSGEKRFTLVSDTEANTNPMLMFAPPPHLFLGDQDPATRAGRIITQPMQGSRMQKEGVTMDIVTPILRNRANGQVQNLGWLRVIRILNDDFFSTIGRQTGVQINFNNADKYAELEQQFGNDIPNLSLAVEGTPSFSWHEDSRKLSGAVKLPGMQGEHGTLVLSIVKNELIAGLNAFKDAVVVVFLLAIIVFVPSTLFFVRTNITRPLNALVDSAVRMTNGERVSPAGAKRNDEIGALAQAFDVMAETVQSRESELYEKQGLLDGMVNNAPSLIQVKDIQGRYLMVNHRWEKFFGLPQAKVLGKTAHDILPATTAAIIQRDDEQVLLNCTADQFEDELTGINDTRTFYATRFPLLDEQGEIYAVCGISQDITNRKKAEHRLRLTQRVVDATVEGIVITDAKNIIVDVNHAFTQITGFPRDEAIGFDPKIMASGRHDTAFYKELWETLGRTGRWSGEIWDRRRNGDVYPKWLSISAIYDDNGQAANYVGVFSDISETKETERQLEHLAHYDALTGLPNRILFQDRLRRALARHRRHQQKGALMFIDLDRFKQVNDTLGHEKGDDLLIEATARLLECTREDDTVARLGGDEFTVVLNELEDESRASEVAERIIHSLEQPFDLAGNEVFISASIGIVVFPGDGDSIEALTRNADMAMYEAKNRGRATFTFFNESMNARLLERMVLETGLRAATENQEFRVYFQPKFNIAKGRIVSTEALVRWMHPKRGLMAPDNFIPLAEETGLIIEIGRWVLLEACRQTQAWIVDQGITLPVAVNISARQFSDPNLADDIARVLEETGLAPSMLAIEVTESMIMDDVDLAVGVLHRLKRLGLSIAIDDFGTGYSSLNQLRRLPVDELKIDRTFVKDIPQSTEDMEIVSAVLSMAKSLNISVVAEGVETLEQLDFLREKGCETAQGYLFGKPVEAKILPIYLRDDGPNADIMTQLDPATRSQNRTLQ